MRRLGIILGTVLWASGAVAAPSAPPLPEAYSGHILLSGGGHLYSLGGLGGINGLFVGDRAWYAPVAGDGSVGAWQEGARLPEPVFFHAGVSHQGTLYVVAGYHYTAETGTFQPSNVVYYSKPGSDGRPASWTAATPLPESVFFPSAAVWEGRMYVMGGWTGSALTSAVYSAPIGADGSLGSWRTERPMPEGNYTHAAVTQGTLYILGGAVNGGSEVHNGVWAATLAADGTLEPWRSETPLPEPVSNHAALIAGGRVYVSGGWTGPAPTNAIVQSDIAGGGTLGSWSTLAMMPKLLYLHGAAAWGNRLYVAGGSDGNTTQDAVLVYELPAPVPPPLPADRVAPVTTLAFDGPRYGEAPVIVSPATRLTLTASDEGSGVARTQWGLGDGVFSSYSGPFTLPEGQHWLRYFSVDAAGNAETVRALAVSADGTPPVSAAAPAGGLLGAEASVAFTAADDSSGVQFVEYSLDGGPWTRGSGTALDEGERSVGLRAVDNLGNVEPARELRYTVDATPPVTTLEVGGAQELFGRQAMAPSTSISLTSVDPVSAGVASGLSGLTYSVDGGPELDYEGPFFLEDGEHVVSFGAVDRAGNREARRSLRLAVGRFVADTVAAKASVTLAGGAQVSGTVTSPVVSLKGGSAVDGEIRRQAPVESMDLEAAAADAAAGNDNALLPADLLTDGKLILHKKSVVLPAGVFHLTGLKLTAGAKLSSSGQVRLFVAGPVAVSGGSSLNATGQADDFWVVSTGESVSVNGQGRAAWNLYAPRADVSFSGGAELAGRVLGNTVSLTGGAAVPSGTTLPVSRKEGRQERFAKRAPAERDLRTQAKPWKGGPQPAPRVAARSVRPAALPQLPVSARAAFSVVKPDEAKTLRTSERSGVVIPQGAARAALAVTVTAASGSDSRREKAAAQASLKEAGSPVEYGPHGTRFEKPVTLEVPYDLSLLPAGTDESTLAVHYWNPGTGAWERLRSSVDRQAGLVRAQTDHFSLYQVMSGGNPAAADSVAFGEVYAYPNPARGQSPRFHVEAAGAEAVTIRIYDVSGAQVHEASPAPGQEHLWNVSGVGSGVYLYVVTAKKGGDTISKRGKVAVLK